MKKRIKPFKFEKILKPKDEFETTAEFEQRKLDYQLEMEEAKIKYQNEANKKIEKINQELNQKKDKLFCYWFNLGETQKLELQYNADKEYFNTLIVISDISIKFNFPVPREQAKDFKKETKFINLDFGIKKNNIFIVEAFATFGSIFQDKFQTKLNIDFSFEKSKKELEKITGKTWKELQKITKLNLRHKGLKKLPISIGGLKNLSSLDLWSNELERLPKWIERLTNLSSLDINGNKNLDFDETKTTFG